MTSGPRTAGGSHPAPAFALPVRVIVEEGAERTEFDHDGTAPISIGRAEECTITLATGRASRQHAEIIGEDGRFTLIDAGSSNGTRIDGERVSRHPLAPGDVIVIGDARITFGEIPPTEPIAVAPTGSTARAPSRSPSRAASAAHAGPAETTDAADAPPASARGPYVKRGRPFAIVELLLTVLLFLILALVAREYLAPPPPPSPVLGPGTPSASAPTDTSTSTFQFGGEIFEREGREALDAVEDLIVDGVERYDVLEDLQMISAEYSDTEAGHRSRRFARVLEALRDSESTARREVAERTLSAWVATERYGEAIVATRFLAQLEHDPDARLDWVQRGQELESIATARLRTFEDSLASLLEAGLGAEALRALVGARDRFAGVAAYESALPRYLSLGLGEIASIERGLAVPPEFVELEAQALRAYQECRFRDLAPILHGALGLDLPPDTRVRVLEELVEAHYLQELWEEFVAGVSGKRVEIALSRNERAEIVRVTDDEVEIERTIEGGKVREVKAWRDVQPVRRTVLFSSVPLGRDALLGLVFLARRGGDPETFESAISRLHRRGKAGAELATAVYARHRGESVPASGYIEYRGRLMTPAEKDAEIARKKELERQEREAIARMKRLEKSEKVDDVIEWVHLLRDQGEFSLASRVLRELVSKVDAEMGAEARRLLEEPLLASVPLRESGDPERRIDFFILGDGYLAEDDHQEAFLGAARSCESILFRVDPYREYASYFNVTAVHLQSKDAGCDRNPPGVERDTACDAKVEWGVITCNPEKVFGHIRNFPEAMARDHQGIVIVNDLADVMTGGGGVATLSKAGLSVVHHEVGHSFGALRDEYDSEPGADPNRPKPPGRQGNVPVRELRPNLMEGSDREAVLREASWKYWIDAGEAAWWNHSKVSVFEGGDRRQFEVWRPQSGCMMRDLTGFCVVCMEVMVKQIYRRVRPIDVLDPPPGEVTIADGEERVFQVTPMQPRSHDLEVEWRLIALGTNDPRTPRSGNTAVAEGEGEVFQRIARRTDLDGRTLHGAQLRSKDLDPGWYRLRVKVWDPTPWVIDDPDEFLVDRAEWLVEVK